MLLDERLLRRHQVILQPAEIAVAEAAAAAAFGEALDATLDPPAPSTSPRKDRLRGGRIRFGHS
jgi:hypothetical protein